MKIIIKEVGMYISEKVQDWNRLRVVDRSYEVKSKIRKGRNRVDVYKVAMMGGHQPTWNFVFGVEAKGEEFVIQFFVDDTEEEIMESLMSSGYQPFAENKFRMKSFSINIGNIDALKSFLEIHVWRFDPGYFY